MSLRFSALMALVVMVMPVAFTIGSQAQTASVTRALNPAFDAMERIIRQDQGYQSFTKEVDSWKIRQNGCLSKQPDSNRLFFDYEEGDGYIQDSETHTTPVTASCKFDVGTTCTGAMILDYSDSYWALEFSRIAYVNAVSLIASRYNVPLSAIQPSLHKMTALVERSLSRKMSGASQLKWDKQDEALKDQELTTELELMRAWNKYRQDTNQMHSVPAFVNEPGCGAGSVKVTFKTQPPGGHLRLITTFDWSLCQAQGTDPWDDNCRGWSEVVTEKVNVSGEYHYIATWSDGTVWRDKFTIRPSNVDQIVNVRR